MKSVNNGRLISGVGILAGVGLLGVTGRLSSDITSSKTSVHGSFVSRLRFCRVASGKAGY